MRNVALVLSLALLLPVACDDSLPTASPDAASPDSAAADSGADQAPPTPDVGGSDFYLSECVGKSDGEVCGADGKSICLDERCVTSSCGDGYLDTAGGEECEDDNEIAGDGCTACRFDCTTNNDCDDGLICTGSESCDVSNHRCLPGGLAKDGTVCQQSSGAQGVCNGGVCVQLGCGNGAPDGNEQCDDGNKVSGDGCENDCTWTCQQNGDCDDGDPCTGKETCDTSDPQKPVCKAGTPTVCSSPNCAGSCDSKTGGCVYPDGDADGVACNKDCDDKDPSVFPGAPECKDGKDNDCDPGTPDGAAGDCRCYVDGDRDGFAPDTLGSLVALPCPKGYTPTRPSSPANTDCFDERSDVKPGQTQWFTKPHCRKFDKAGLCTSTSFDYDCSGASEQRYTAVHTSCKGLGSKCNGEGWGGSVPKCGVTAPYVICKSQGSFLPCLPIPSSRVQACR